MGECPRACMWKGPAGLADLWRYLMPWSSRQSKLLHLTSQIPIQIQHSSLLRPWYRVQANLRRGRQSLPSILSSQSRRKMKRPSRVSVGQQTSEVIDLVSDDEGSSGSPNVKDSDSDEDVESQSLVIDEYVLLALSLLLIISQPHAPSCFPSGVHAVNRH
jgi:hypothetical protein